MENEFEKLLKTVRPKEPKPFSADISPILEKVRSGVSGQESGGNTKAKNPRTSALGEFQVLPSNVRPWTRKHLGQELSENEFYNNPDAQRKVFDGEFGGYLSKALQKAPDEDTAIRMAAAGWYGGEGAMHRFDDDWRPRANEPSFKEYTSKVLQRTRGTLKGTRDPLSTPFGKLLSETRQAPQPPSEFEQLLHTVRTDSPDESALRPEERVQPNMIPEGVPVAPQPTLQAPGAIVAANAMREMSPDTPPPVMQPPAVPGAPLAQQPVLPRNVAPTQVASQIAQQPVSPAVPQPIEPEVAPEASTEFAGDRVYIPEGKPANVSARDWARDTVAQKLSEHGVPLEDAMAFARTKPLLAFGSDAEADESVLVAGHPIDVGADFVEEAKQYSAQRKEAEVARQKAFGLKDKLVQDYTAQGLDSYESEIFAAKDAGLISDEDFEKEIQQYRYERENIANQTEAERSTQEMYRSGMSDTASVPLPDDNFESSVNSALANLQESKLKTLREGIERYGFAQRFRSEENRIQREYGTNVLKAPLEAAKRIGLYALKIPGNLLKAGAVAQDADISTTVVNYLRNTDAGRATKNPMFQVGDEANKKLDSFKNDDFRNDFIVNDLSEAAAQIATQTILAPLTGGASLALPLSEASVAQYEAADKGGASRSVKLLAAGIAGLAAVPDAILKAKYVRFLTPADKGNFISKFANRLFGGLAEKVGEQEARELTRVSLLGALKNGAFGFGGEYSTEALEDVVNKSVAKLTYAPNTAITPTKEEARGYLAAGFGGLFGGAVETVAQNEAVNQAERVSLYDKNENTQPENAPSTKEVLPTEQAAEPAAEPLPSNETKIVEDKRGQRYEVLGEREDGFLDVRNVDTGGTSKIKPSKVTEVSEVEASEVEPQAVKENLTTQETSEPKASVVQEETNTPPSVKEKLTEQSDVKVGDRVTYESKVGTVTGVESSKYGDVVIVDTDSGQTDVQWPTAKVKRDEIQQPDVVAEAKENQPEPPSAELVDTPKPKVSRLGVILPDGGVAVRETVNAKGEILKSAKPSLPKLETNDRTELSTYSPTLYRETDPSKALELLGGNPDPAQRLFLANTPNLARGQGANKGVLIEMDSQGLQGSVNTSKPGWEVAYNNGEAEFVGTYNKSYADNVSKVTITNEGKRLPRVRTLNDSLISKGWNRTIQPNGDIVFSKPSLKSATPDTKAIDRIKAQPEFQRFIKDSAVQDIVYHGTKSSDIEIFDIKRSGTSDPGVVGKAFYFTPNAEQSGHFAESAHYGNGKNSNVIPAYISIKNPYVIQDGITPEGQSLSDIHPNGLTKTSSAAFKRRIIAQGFDGVIFKDREGNVEQVAAFEPTQIKSIFNEGTFDSSNPSILKKVRTPESVDKLSTFTGRDRTLGDIRAAANPKVTADGLIEVDEQTSETLRRVNEVAGLGDTSMYGQFLEPSQAQAVVKILKEEAADLASVPEAAKHFENLAKAIEFVAKKPSNQGTVITFLYDDAIPHEKTHRARYFTALDKSLKGRHANFDGLTKLTGTDGNNLLDTAYKNFFKPRGYKAESKAVLIEEAATEAASGNWEAMGWNLEDAREFLKADARSRYDGAKSKDANYTVAKFVDQQKNINQAYDNILDQVREYYEENQSSERTESKEPDSPDSQQQVTGERDRQTDRQTADERTIENESNLKARRYGETLRRNGREVEDSLYIPDTEKGWINRAQEVITESAADDDYKSAFAAMKGDKLSEGEKTALGIALIDHMGSIGDLARMNEAANLTIDHVGTAAQALRASQIAGKYDFATAVRMAIKAKERTGKTELTNRETIRVTDKLNQHQDAADTHALTEFALSEAQNEVAEIIAEEQELSQAGKDADTRRILEAEELAAKDKEIAYWKSKAQADINKRQVTARRRGKASEVYEDISARKADILKSLQDKFKVNDSQSLLMAAPTVETNEAHDDLRDYATLLILDHMPYKDTMAELERVTNNQLPLETLQQIHADAEFSIPTGKVSPKAKENAQIRAEHRRQARSVKGTSNLKKPSRYEMEVMKLGNQQGVSNEVILGAFTLPQLRTPDAVEKWTRQIQQQYPDADTKAVFKAAWDLRTAVKESIKAQQAEAQLAKQTAAKDIKQLEVQKRTAASKQRAAQRNLERYYEQLSRSWGGFVFDSAKEALDITKGLTATGDLSYIMRQGFLPLILETRAGVKGDWQGIGHGLQGDNELQRWGLEQFGQQNAADYLQAHSLHQFVEQIREHPRFNEAQLSGLRFTKIGDINVADEHFSSKMLEKIPMYRRMEDAYTLPGDLQRLFVFDAWAKIIDGQNLNPAQDKIAKKYAAEVANAFTGKGDIGKVLAKGGALSKVANFAFFSPSLLISRFQSAYFLSTGFATAPKGMKAIMLRKGLRFYGVLGLMAYLLGMGFDPEDDNFGQVDVKKGSWLQKALGKDAEDLHFNFTAGMDKPLKLALGTAKGLFNAMATGDKNYLTDALVNQQREFGVSKQGEPRFLRGKLSPSMSWAVDYYTGKDFIGRPYTHYGAMSSRVMPLGWSQAWDSVMYDQAQNAMKEPASPESVKEKWNKNERKYANMAAVFFTNFLGGSVTQYPKNEQSPATQKAADLSTAISKKTDEERRVEGGLKTLMKKKLDAEAAGENVAKIKADILAYARKYGYDRSERAELRAQVKNPTGLLMYYSKDLLLPELERVFAVANEEEKSKLTKLINKKRKKATPKPTDKPEEPEAVEKEFEDDDEE